MRLTDNYYIAGIFVKETAQSHGIGKKPGMSDLLP